MPQPYFGDEQWREVIPLAALLGGKETEALVQGLTEQVRGLDRDKVISRNRPSEGAPGREPHQLVLALGNCLGDEVPARPATIRAALSKLVQAARALDGALFVPPLVRGRYGLELREEARKIFVAPNADSVSAGEALLQLCMVDDD